MENAGRSVAALVLGRKRAFQVVRVVALAAIGFSSGSSKALSNDFSTYNEAIQDLLRWSGPGEAEGCENLVGSSPRDPDTGAPFNFGAQLADICAAIETSGSGSASPNSSSAPGPSSARTVFKPVQEQLRQLREEEAGEEGGGGASADEGGFGIALTDRLGMFLSIGGRTLDKDISRFEDGYDSWIVDVTLGGDYKVTDQLAIGLAFNYAHFDGDYDGGGDFSDNSYGGLLYGSFTPFANSFIEGVLGYTRIDYDRRLPTSYTNEAEPVAETFGGTIRGDYSADQYSAGFLSGYDFPIDNFSIGPRVGLAWIYTKTEKYQQDGNTGLELEFSSDAQSSLQSSLGFSATAAFSTDFGVLVPQLGAAWIHEFLNDSRNVEASFAQDNRPQPLRFSFKREKPVRDWGEINLGVSAVLPNGLQPFVNFATLVGNNRFTSYGGSAGLRVDW